MTREFGHYMLIVVGMGLSFIISSYLLQTLFIEKTPVLNWNSFSTNIAQLKQSTLLAQSSVLDYIQQVTKPIDSARLTPVPQTNSFFFDPLPAPTYPQAPTAIPTPTQYIKPTVVSTLIPLPTVPKNIPTPIRSTPKPTIKPSPTPSPTKTPKPTIKIDFPKVVGDPLKQTWYGVGSLACYTPERFIQVYANGLTPNTCYNNIRSYMDANIVSTMLLGRTIQVHKKALPAFEAVAKTLDQYKADSSTYKFPSKTYNIKNVGAYIFRCNVNASTGNPYDTCQSGCVIGAHAFGIAVDINYEENCNGCNNYDMPKEIWKTFEKYGFRWGGHYPFIGSKIDPMHFEYMRDLCNGI